MKQIEVVKERCIGCGACIAIDEEHFAFDEEGKSSVISNENLESGNLVNAIESCPTCAIAMTEQESESNDNLDPKMEEESCSCEACDCPENCTCETTESDSCCSECSKDSCCHNEEENKNEDN